MSVSNSDEGRVGGTLQLRLRLEQVEGGKPGAVTPYHSRMRSARSKRLLTVTTISASLFFCGGVL